MNCKAYKWPLCVCGLCMACGCSPGPDTEPPDAGQDAGACAAELSLGQLGSSGFTAYQDGDTAYVTRGFQGFRFIDAAARLKGMDLPAAIFRMRVTVEGHDPNSQDTSSGLIQGADGALFAEHVMVFFNDLPMPELIGRKTDIEVRVKSADCTADFAVQVILQQGECQAVPADAGVIDGGDPSCTDAGL